MLTQDDIARYLSETRAVQSVEAMRPSFARWLRRLRELGLADVPLTLGSESARRVDLFALQDSVNLAARQRAHDVRDTVPDLRPYKGR